MDGQLGGTWQGDGTAAYIRVAHSERLMVNDAITVALWLFGGIPPDQVLCKSNGSGAGWQSNYAIGLDDQAPARRINWRGRAVANQSLTSPSPVPDNEWVHITCTATGVAELSLWFRGSSDNAAEPMYVALFNAAGAPAIVVNEDAEAARARGWKEWRVPLQAFAAASKSFKAIDVG